MMNKANGKIIRLLMSHETYDEFKILSIRAKKSEHDLIVEVLDKYIEKKKDKSSIE